MESASNCVAVFHFPKEFTATALCASPPADAAHSRIADMVISLPMMIVAGAAMDTARALAHARAGQGATLQLAICVWLRAAFLGAAAAPVLRLLDLVLGELLQWWTAGDGDEMDAALARLGWCVGLWTVYGRCHWATEAATRRCYLGVTSVLRAVTADSLPR